METKSIYFVPPHVSCVKYRNPYYVMCSNCKIVISDTDPDNLREQIIDMGWVLDYKNDLLYCDYCYKSIDKCCGL